jgi:hypothetical protein
MKGGALGSTERPRSEAHAEVPRARKTLGNFSTANENYALAA